MKSRHSLHSLFPATRTCCGLLALLLILPCVSTAETTPATGKPVSTLQAFKRVAAKDAAGTESLVAAAKVLPGEEVVYVLTTTNPGAVAVTDLSVSLPVPAEMIYSVGSAEAAGATVAFSVDGGRTFGAIDQLRVVAPDGAWRPGVAEDINLVRWTFSQPLAAGATMEVRCRATLK